MTGYYLMPRCLADNTKKKKRTFSFKQEKLEKKMESDNILSVKNIRMNCFYY